MGRQPSRQWSLLQVMGALTAGSLVLAIVVWSAVYAIFGKEAALLLMWWSHR